MRLLLQSENEKHIAQMNWKPAVIDEYVTNEDIIKTLVEHAHAHEGTKLRRTLVLIELFKENNAFEKNRR